MITRGVHPDLKLSGSIPRPVPTTSPSSPTRASTWPTDNSRAGASYQRIINFVRRFSPVLAVRVGNRQLRRARPDISLTTVHSSAPNTELIFRGSHFNEGLARALPTGPSPQGSPPTSTLTRQPAEPNPYPAVSRCPGLSSSAKDVTGPPPPPLNPLAPPLYDHVSPSRGASGCDLKQAVGVSTLLGKLSTH